MEFEDPAKKRRKKCNTIDKYLGSNTSVNTSSDDIKKVTHGDELKWKKITAVGLDLDYCSQFYSKHEANKILDHLEEKIEYFTGNLAKVFVYGKWHDVPRKQVAFGEPGLSYKFSGISVPSQPWPTILKEIKEKVSKVTGYQYNFVLVNRYKDGCDYMAEHRDNEKELDPYTPIASISLGQSRDFIFTHASAKNKGKTSEAPRIQPNPIKLVLEHGSLLLMKYPTNIHWYHSLPRRKTAPGLRINLTFRKLILESCGK